MPFPDSIRYFNGKLLVTLLTGFPFAAGNSKVMSVDPVTGAFEPVLENLTSTIDVAPRARFLRPLQFLVLEHSANLLSGAPGRLKLVGFNSTEILADGHERSQCDALRYRYRHGLYHVAHGRHDPEAGPEELTGSSFDTETRKRMQSWSSCASVPLCLCVKNTASLAPLTARSTASPTPA
jgi:hypothetical protein